MKVVSTKNLVKDYTANGHTVHALRGISVAFQQGEFSAIVGPSGSGKSTLLHIVGCLDLPTSGEVWVAGDDVSTLSRKELAFLRRQRIGFVFQAYNLIPVLTALENVSFPLILLNLGRKEAQKRAVEALASVGLAGMENRKPKEMSGGQQQRIAVARALVKQPSLVLADEPTANLDSKTGAEILQLMLELNRSIGTTFIFSTHDRMVMEYARRLIYLQDGEIEREDHQ